MTSLAFGPAVYFGGFTSALSTYISSTTNATSSTTHTWTDHAIGTASGDRYVVVGITWRSIGGGTLSSATIGGVSATIHQHQLASNEGTAIIGLLVTSGTTATIVATFSASASRGCVHVFHITSLISSTPTATLNATGADPTGTINVSAGGVIIAVAANDSSATTTWTGVTERNDQVNSETTTSGSLDYAAAVVNQTITADFTSASTATSLTAVSFQ